MPVSGVSRNDSLLPLSRLAVVKMNHAVGGPDGRGASVGLLQMIEGLAFLGGFVLHMANIARGLGIVINGAGTIDIDSMLLNSLLKRVPGSQGT